MSPRYVGIVLNILAVVVAGVYLPMVPAMAMVAVASISLTIVEFAARKEQSDRMMGITSAAVAQTCHLMHIMDLAIELSKRHEYSPEMGECVCEPHIAFERAVEHYETKYKVKRK